jgi:hypothetical protein
MKNKKHHTVNKTEELLEIQNTYEKLDEINSLESS